MAASTSPVPSPGGNGRVIVVGSVNVDLVVTTRRLPGVGETVTGGRFDRHQGGKGGNQAVAAARLGVPTAFVGAIGEDAFGAEARSAFEAEGVDLQALIVKDHEPTGVALIVVDADGENLIAVAGGANVALTPDDVRLALRTLAPDAGDIVLVGHEIPTPACREALRLGRAAGATTILNPAPADGLDRWVFSLADVLTPNRRELATLVWSEGERLGRPGVPGETDLAARTLLETNAEGPGVASAVLVTLGATGGLLVTAEGAVDLDPPPVDAVDAVGAGDTLNGALAAGLAEGRSLEDAARRAVAAASLAVTRPGARTGMPTGDELEASLRV
ncbi:MAG: ribokinase [Chloroflexota bacterium]